MLAAEVAWKARAELTKKDEGTFKTKMEDAIKAAAALKTKIGAAETSAEDKA